MATSRIDDLRLIDPVLTTISQGYENPAFIAEVLFPTVSVSKLKGKIPSFGKDSFIVRATDRAIRANSNRIIPAEFEMVNFSTQEQDIEIAIDYLEEEESPDYFKYEQRVAKNLSDILKIGKEKKAADLAQDPLNFASGLYSELTEDYAFNNPSSVFSPLDIIKDAMSSVRNKIAVYPNTIVMGISVYNTLLTHPMIISLIQYSGFSKITKELLAKILDVDTIHVGMGVHTEDGSEFSDIWGGNVILAYVDKSAKGKRNEYNPSWGYTFQREGMPQIDTYYENGGKIKVVRNTDNYGLVITGSEAAFLIKDAVQEISEGE